jgi:hypothetical protein
MQRHMTPEEKIDERKRAYEMTFSTPHGQTVLADIMRLGFAFESTGLADDTGRYDTHASAEANGARKIWLHIQQQLEWSHEQLIELYLGKRN